MRYQRIGPIAFVCFVWLFSGAPAFAQTECAVNCSVSAGQKFTAFTEALSGGVDYLLTVDGIATSHPSRLVNGLVEFDHPGFATKGTHVLEIMVVVNGQWVTLTEPFTLSVVKRQIHIRK